ncbi:hypothetical protein K239x_00270 [Planctomycetes bacterium K23_9]|uniref:Uncharacterized protein n=1 Tax=Stieleria marina TaxID=1930275 RepID=A0A517NLU8_9BACT|nr:hypothetical protein K239x_00270 [Planctomycetes bacterium K23_9]
MCEAVTRQFLDLQFWCAKVYQECVFKVSRCKLTKNLCQMSVVDIAGCLEFDQLLSINNQVGSILSQRRSVLIKHSD